MGRQAHEELVVQRHEDNEALRNMFSLGLAMSKVHISRPATVHDNSSLPLSAFRVRHDTNMT